MRRRVRSFASRRTGRVLPTGACGQAPSKCPGTGGRGRDEPQHRTAQLVPAYDFVSMVPYIADKNAALKYPRTGRMAEFTMDDLAYLAAKARLPEKLFLDTAAETVSTFRAL